MKQIFFFLLVAIALTSCTITIPLQSNLSDQTMLLAENRNIKANYTLSSNIPDGFISYVSVLKNGSETINNGSYKYASESAFKKIWNSYLSSKFNNYAKDQMDIEVTLKDIKLREQAATSIGMTMLTGNTKVNVDAIAIFHVVVNYHGEKYENQFEVTASDYNESQQMKYGNTYYTANQTNPTQQKAKLLESCLNKSIIQFENYLRSVMLADKESN
jgi:hypothetical protein